MPMMAEIFLKGQWAQWRSTQEGTLPVQTARVAGRTRTILRLCLFFLFGDDADYSYLVGHIGVTPSLKSFF
jgi:hypothetical protein